MVNRILADLVVVVHFAYAMTIVLGLFAIFIGCLRNWDWVRNRWFRVIHLLMITIVVVESWLNIPCPLTSLEKHLRANDTSGGYEGDFIARWVHELLFFNFPPRLFTAVYSAFGLLVLLSVILVKPNWRPGSNVGQQPDTN